MIRFTIIGQAYSKANSRKIVSIGGRPSSIKSKEARQFEANTIRQIPPAARQRIEGPVRVTLRMFYANERPDLDESLLLDCLQDRWGKRIEGRIADDGTHLGTPVVGGRPLLQAGVYRNDRQVREKHVYHGIDKANPRVEIEVEPMQAQAGWLPLAPLVERVKTVPTSLLFPDELPA